MENSPPTALNEQHLLMECVCLCRSPSYGFHLRASAHDRPLRLDVQQPYQHVFIGLLQLSGADLSGSVSCVLPEEGGVQESQRRENHPFKLSHVTNIKPLY